MKLIASYEENRNCTVATSHFNTVASCQLRALLDNSPRSFIQRHASVKGKCGILLQQT